MSAETIVSAPPRTEPISASAPPGDQQDEGWRSVLAELRAIRRALERDRAEAIGARDAAALCSKGLASWHRLNAAKLIPKPVRLGGSVRWLKGELLAWLQAGAPPRAQWESMRRATK